MRRAYQKDLPVYAISGEMDPIGANNGVLALVNRYQDHLGMYLHLPMTMGIAAVGTAILNVVEGAAASGAQSTPSCPGVRWLQDMA
ncbi:MAG TPA: hypothetical protein VLY63_11490 [Anaerolineae bacterium]|nr:hypothetical protein [Anaerolineae bacterium]